MKLTKDDLKNPLNTKGINTNFWFLHLIQIHDSAFPTGTFSHSFGMETYMFDRTVDDKESVFEFCEMYLRHSIGATDAIIAKEAFYAAKDNDIDELLKLESICKSIKLATEARKSSSMLGRQFIRTVSQISEDKLVLKWQDKVKSKEIEGHYPLVYGIYAASLGIAIEIVVATYLYSAISALVQNAVRAVPIGQNAGVSNVYNLLPIIEEVTAEVLQKGLDDMNNNTIALEVAQMKHEFANARLFMS